MMKSVLFFSAYKTFISLPSIFLFLFFDNAFYTTVLKSFFLIIITFVESLRKSITMPISQSRINAYFYIMRQLFVLKLKFAKESLIENIKYIPQLNLLNAKNSVS